MWLHSIKRSWRDLSLDRRVNDSHFAEDDFSLMWVQIMCRRSAALKKIKKKTNMYIDLSESRRLHHAGSRWRTVRLSSQIDFTFQMVLNGLFGCRGYTMSWRKLSGQECYLSTWKHSWHWSSSDVQVKTEHALVRRRKNQSVYWCQSRQTKQNQGVESLDTVRCCCESRLVLFPANAQLRWSCGTNTKQRSWYFLFTDLIHLSSQTLVLHFVKRARSIMGRGASEEWDEKPHDTRQTQPKRGEESDSDRNGSSGRSCPKCCLRTRDCLMSAECGRALQISSVVAMCGMCLRMFVCKCRENASLLRWIWICANT